MTFVQKMFSFEGRLRRQDFWITTLILWGVNIAAAIVLAIFAFGPLMALGMAAEHNGGEPDTAAAMATMVTFLPAIAIFGLLQLALIWPSLAVDVKRFHDRDQSGWLVLIIVFCRMIAWIPIVGLLPGIASFLFWLINLGILEGTPGPNRYGESPKPEFGPERVFA